AVAFAVRTVALVPLPAPGAMDRAALSSPVTLLGVEATSLRSLVALVLWTAVAYARGLTGLQNPSAPVAGELRYAGVVLAALAAWALLGEALTAPQIIGGLVVIAGVFTAQRAVAGRRADAEKGEEDELAPAAV